MDFWAVASEFLDSEPSIALLKFIPIAIVMEIWGNRIQNKHVTFFSDNKAAVAMVNKQTLHCLYCMALVRFIVMHCLHINIELMGTQSDQNPSEDLHPGNLHKFMDTIVIDKDLVQITTCENYHTLTSQVPIKLVVGSHTMFAPGSLELPDQFNELGPQLCEQAVTVMTDNSAPHSKLTFKAFNCLNRERQEPH